MINAGIFLVPAIHEIAAAAELAITTRAAKKPYTHPLTDRPALDVGTKGIDAPDHFMTWDTRPLDRERALPPCRNPSGKPHTPLRECVPDWGRGPEVVYLLPRTLPVAGLLLLCRLRSYPSFKLRFVSGDGRFADTSTYGPNSRVKRGKSRQIFANQMAEPRTLGRLAFLRRWGTISATRSQALESWLIGGLSPTLTAETRRLGLTDGAAFSERRVLGRRL